MIQENLIALLVEEVEDNKEDGKEYQKCVLMEEIL